MNPDEPTSASAGAVDGCPPDISSAFPPPSPIPSLRLTQPLPPPPTGLYFGLACLGSLGAACVLLFTPWLGLFFPVFLAAVPLGAAGIASAHQDSRRRGLIVSTVGATIAGVLLVQLLLLVILLLSSEYTG
jgi:hypothetical protein